MLEHLPDPAGQLRQLEQLLTPGGAFFVEGPLEANASLVHGTSAGLGALKKLAWRAEGDFPPFHLFRNNARAQRDQFAKRMAYDVQSFPRRRPRLALFTGDKQLLRPSGVGDALKSAIGLAAVGAGRAAGLLGFPVGNGFGAIARPKQ